MEMGLEAASVSLEHAVAALFTPPQAVHTDTCATCSGSLELPAAWRALRDFPVCARFVVTAWCRLGRSLAPMQTPSTNPAKRKSVTLNSSVSKLRATSMARLCAVLYQCGLVAGRAMDDSELVAMVVDAADEQGSTERKVLCRVLQQPTLARCVRFRLFQQALSTQTHQSDSSWVGEAARPLAEELRQASIGPIAREGPSTTSPARKSKKRGRGSMGKSAKTADAVVCEVCANGRGVDARAVRSHRKSLVESLEKWLRMGDIDDSVGEAVKGLVDVLNAPEVVHLLERVSTIARPRTISSVRSSRVVPSPKIRWEDCNGIVDAIGPTSFWRLVWRRERSRRSSASPTGTLEELVVVCAIADQFAHSTRQTLSGHGDAAVGFRVLRTVIRQSVKRPDQIVTTVRAISAAWECKRASATSAVSKTSLHAIHRRLIDYVRIFLDHDEIQDAPLSEEVTAKGRAKKVSKTAIRHVSATGDLLEGVALVYALVLTTTEHTEKVSRGDQRVLFELWFQLVVKFSGHASSHHGSVAAPPWSSFLDAVAQCWEELYALSHHCTLGFEAFVGEIVVGILISGGARISAPEGCNLQLAISMEDASQSILQALLGMILNTDTSGRVVVTCVYRLVLTTTRQQQVRRQSNTSAGGAGFPRMLFPLLNAYTSSSGTATDATVSNLVAQVQSKLRTQRDSRRLARTLVLLLHEWDSYSARHTKEVVAVGSHEHGDKHGLRAARENGVWQDLVRFYASDQSDCLGETPAFLGYIADLLRSIDPDDCPSELDGTLFNVVTQITRVLSHSQACRDQEVKVAHSDETISRFLRAFESPTSDNGDSRDLVDMLKKAGKLEDLALTLRRWLGILSASPSALPAETVAKLVMLANRLVFWCGSDLTTVRALLVPVDVSLLSALQFYSTCPPSSTSQVSVVRLSVMVRGYLAISHVPNLVALTAAILDAALSCTTSSARDGLLKLLQGFAAFLVTEVVTDKLSSALLLVGDRTHSRLVRNALAVMTIVPEILRPRIVAFTHDVFSVATAERWLTTLLLVGVVPPESTSKSLWEAVEALVACLESLLGPQERSEGSEGSAAKAFCQAYALEALLSSTLLALPRNGELGSLSKRVHEISRQLQSHIRGLDEIPMMENLSEPERASLLLIVTRSTQYQRRSKHPSEKGYTCGLVRVDRRGVQALALPPPHPLGWTKSLDLTVAEADAIELGRPTQCYLTFSSWLASALAAQQQLLPSTKDSDAWETLFSETALQFYLPVQFYGEMDALVSEWLATWIAQSLVVGNGIKLLPFQRCILLQHLAIRSAWGHLAQCARLLLNEIVPHAVGREIMVHVVGSLDLAVLSSTQSLTCDAMADDISALLETLLHRDSTHPLTILAPLLEAFVRASLLALARDPNDQSRVTAAAHRVGVFVQQVLARSTTMGTWWNELLATWTRQFSHMNRREATRIIGGLQWQLPSSAEGENGGAHIHADDQAS